MSPTLISPTSQTVSKRRAERAGAGRLGSLDVASLRPRSNCELSSVNAACFADADLSIPVATLAQKWTISHVLATRPATGMEFGLTKTYHQRPMSPSPG